MIHSTSSERPDQGVTFGRRDLFRLGGLAAAAVTAPGLLTACSRGSSSSSGGATGRLRVSQTDAVSTLDPQKQGSMVDMSALSNIFDFLTRREDDGRLVGGLATEWEAVENTRWRFQLREGVSFHNGEPFNAAAAKFSLDRLLDPATKSPIVELETVDHIEQVDEYTIDIVTKAPDPLIPAKVSLFGGVMVPPEYIKSEGDAHFAKNPVGTGPYKFVSWERDSALRLEANPDHYLGPPGLDELELRPVPNPSTAVSSLQSGDLDMVTGLTADAMLQLEGDDSVRVVEAPSIRTYYVALDTLSDGPLADKRVRQALNYAVNVPELIESALGGAAKQVATIIPPENFGHDPSVEPYPFDLQKAKDLLAEAGYPNGFSIELTGQNSDSSIVQAITGQLRAAGIDATPRLLDPGSFESGLLADKSAPLGPMFYVGNTAWTMDASNNVQSYIDSKEPLSRWHNSRADQLVTIEETSIDPERRKQAFSELQQLMKEEAPFIFLYQIKNLYAMRTEVDYPTNALGLLRMDKAQIEA